MTRLSSALAAGILLAAGAFAGPPPPGFRVSAANALSMARAGETVEIALTALPGLAAEDLRKLHVRDAAGGPELLSQAVDQDGDGRPDQLVFQADFGPAQTRTFLLEVGDRRPPSREDFRVYGRFVRERQDDFAWENDRVAFRTYGAALETWAPEPLTSSAVDVWVKRTRRLVVNDWYMVDDYHRDHGEGADLYSAGRSRGCGGSGLWREGRLFVSRNFRGSRVLANGPLRLVFELAYEPWDAGGARVSETKRVTLDAGSHLNRFESRYAAEGVLPADLQWAAGIRKDRAGEVRADRAAGTLRTWEPVKDGNGELGCGVVVGPEAIVTVGEADGNAVFASRLVDGRAVYHAGFAWTKSGDVASMADWDRMLDEAARRLRSPLKVAVQAR